ncbi:NUDIX hydrolase [Strigomonas culicis]|uniref:NUDIX hydrolase n=1 Tax=Strigomonas culicis TaxID=28005 RepID=S9VR83_9TRYP|nr:NUDIX hydrolase [Strigomonas culicis]|eukprot:EPY25675.1 NUDIX hydrolase [Strigomonas culicis]
MVRRHAKARFIPDAYVFPGGGVDDEDAEAVERYLHRAGLPSPRPDLYSARVASLRELSEETGCVLRPDGSVEAVSTFQQARRGLAPDIYDVEAAPLLTLLGRWITPEGYAFRNDTYFFGAVVDSKESAPQQLALTPDPSEIADIVWIAPDEALRRHEDPRFDFTLPAPTFFLLHALAQERQLARLSGRWEAQRASIREPEVVPITQRVARYNSVENGGRTFFMPGSYYCSLSPSALLRDGHYQYTSFNVGNEGREYCRVVIGDANEGEPVVHLSSAS